MRLLAWFKANANLDTVGLLSVGTVLAAVSSVLTGVSKDKDGYCFIWQSVKVCVALPAVMWAKEE